MTEIEFEKVLVDLAHMFGWIIASFRPAQTGKGWRTPVKYDGKGYPDLTLIHPDGFIIFAELKSLKGAMSDEQKTWRDVIEACASHIIGGGGHNQYIGPDPVRYFLWKPSDAKQIAQVLSFGRVTEWAL